MTELRLWTHKCAALEKTLGLPQRVGLPLRVAATALVLQCSRRGDMQAADALRQPQAAAAAVAVAAKIPPPRATLQDRLCVCGAERAGNQALHEHDSGQRHLYWEAHGVDLDTVWLSSRSMEYNAHMRQQRANKERICDTAQHR